MKHPAKPPTRPGRALHRIFRNQVDLALGHLRDPHSEWRARSIHEARKSLKRLRALLRLLRRWLGPATSRRESERLRRLSRQLAPERDAAALLEALRALPHPARLRPAVQRTRLQLDAPTRQHRPTRRPPGTPGTRPMQQVLVRLRTRLEAWPWDQLTWGDLRAGLRGTYRSGRRALDQAKSSKSTRDLHDWRKPVKFLGLQLAILAALRSRVPPATLRALHRIAADCGEEHDLSLLAEFLHRQGPDLPASGPLTRRVDDRRHELSQSAFRRGRRVYAGKSGAFARHIIPA